MPRPGRSAWCSARRDLRAAARHPRTTRTPCDREWRTRNTLPRNPSLKAEQAHRGSAAAQPAAVPEIDAAENAHRPRQVDRAAPGALLEVQARLRREGLSVPEGHFDIVHLEIAARDVDLDRREPSFACAHDNSVVIESEAH